MMKIKIFSVALLFLLISFGGCKSIKKGYNELNFFSVAQDVELGKKVSMEIAANPKEFPVLPEKGNEAAYAYIRKISSKILNSGAVEYRSVFKWDLKIIKDDKTLNAFCTPGGYIYVYTGLIKALDNENQLAGVMGHEMAHAARRHSTRQLTKIYGLTFVEEALLGKGTNSQEQMKQLAIGLIGLSFSREHETEADNYSVAYLCGTDYKADGCAGFFEKIKGQPTPPAFLSTHPSPVNRIQNIKAKAVACKGTKEYKTEYQQFKSLLK